MSHGKGTIPRSLPDVQPPPEGAIPGIYIGIFFIILVIVIIALIYFWYKKQKKF